MRHDMRQRCVNVMLGVHLGDAMGVPFEMMSRQEILNATGGEGVTGPRFDLDPARRKIPDARGLPPGSTSDDSQLADATAEGFILAACYVPELHVLLHLRELWRSAAGWGDTTETGLYELDKWYRARRRGFRSAPEFRREKSRKRWSEAEPRDPRHPARWRPNARGNGPAMQIAPFGIRYGLLGGGDFDTGEALEEILQFSRMTHADPVCAVAAYAVAAIISDSVAANPDLAALRILERVEAAERALIFLHRGPDRFSAALEQALKLADDPEALWAFGSVGKSDALSTVPMAIAIWRRHVADFGPQPALLEAINAGGDTDTVAAMVGAMMGASSDAKDWWPAEWVAALKDGGARAKALGKDLHDVCGLRRLPHGYDLDEIKKGLGYA